MSLPYHHAYTGTQLHRVARDFADAAALAAFVPVEADEGKLYKQLDTGVVYELTDYSGPTYEVFNAGGIADEVATQLIAAGALTTSTPADVLQGSLFAADTGVADAYVVDLSPAISSYVTGTVYRFGAGNANTGASTVNINSVGAVSIVKVAGGVTTALAANDIRAGQIVEIVYDGTNMQLQSTLGNAAFTALTKADVLQAAEFAADAGGSDAYAITLSPAITAYVTGARYRFKANTANTGAATLNINGVGAQTIKKLQGGVTTDLSDNDIRAGQWVEVVWDGTNFQMVSMLGNVPTPSTTPVCIQVAVSDETTALTTGAAKVTFRAPYAFTLTSVRASVTTAPTGGTLLAVDINEGGVSVLSTVLTFDASEKTTTTAATPAVISDSSIADDAEITIDIDAVGSTVAGAGLKVTLIGTKP